VRGAPVRLGPGLFSREQRSRIGQALGRDHVFESRKPITFLTRKGIISPKLQLLSGHAEENSLAIYRDLALADVSDEYEQAMRSFPIR
jgi:hypothetical protein